MLMLDVCDVEAPALLPELLTKDFSCGNKVVALTRTVAAMACLFRHCFARATRVGDLSNCVLQAWPNAIWPHHRVWVWNSGNHFTASVSIGGCQRSMLGPRFLCKESKRSDFGAPVANLCWKILKSSAASRLRNGQIKRLGLI